MPPSYEASRRFGHVAWAAVAGSVLSAVAAATPWTQSGSVRRSGYRLIGLAASLGVSPLWAVRILLVALALLPALAAGAWIGASLRRIRLVVTLATAAGAVAITSSLAVLRSPLHPMWGVTATLIAGAATAAAAVWTSWATRGAQDG